jgi:hypothetical protein
MVDECLRSEGLATSRVQVVKSFSPTDVDHWAMRWNAAGASTWWIGDGLMYHEDVAIVGRTPRVFDPTDNAWVDETALTGYGRIVAIRFVPAVRGVEGYWAAHADGDWHITGASTHELAERAS